MDDESIMLGNCSPACILCGEVDRMIEYRGKIICRKCIKKLGK